MIEIEVLNHKIPIMLESYDNYQPVEFIRVFKYYPIYLLIGGQLEFSAYIAAASRGISAGLNEYNPTYALDAFIELVGPEQYKRFLKTGNGIWSVRADKPYLRSFLTPLGITNSPYSVPKYIKGMDCPYCKHGMVTGRMNMETMTMESWDHCLLCGQLVTFEDLAEHG